jgi:hypothetical protein
MCRNLGHAIPQRIADSPQIALGNELYIAAYIELDTERSKSMGSESIPFSAILRYAKYVELHADEISDLVYVIRKIDNAMIKYSNEKNK